LSKVGLSLSTYVVNKYAMLQCSNTNLWKAGMWQFSLGFWQYM